MKKTICKRVACLKDESLRTGSIGTPDWALAALTDRERSSGSLHTSSLHSVGADDDDADDEESGGVGGSAVFFGTNKGTCGNSDAARSSALNSVRMTRFFNGHRDCCSSTSRSARFFSGSRQMLTIYFMGTSISMK